MTDRGVERAAGPESAPQPSRRARLTAWGAVVLIVLGALLGAWACLRLEDAVPVPLLGPLAAKIFSVGLVFTGGALLSHVGGRTSGLE